MENTGNKTLLWYRISIVVMLVVIAILLWQLITLKSQVQTIIIEKTQTADKNYELQHELDSLLLEHERIKLENKEVSGKLAQKDSIIMANAEEIRKLIASQADYYRIKKKLDLLRNITQGYIQQIDSLYTVNRELKAEVVKIKQEYKVEKEKTAVLEKDKEQLTEKVNTAALLKAYNVSITPIRVKSGGKKEEIAEKAKKTDKLKVCFTLSENPIAASGNKTVYFRISQPDGRVLFTGDEDASSFVGNGERLQFSIKQDIQYENKAKYICAYWSQTDEFKQGNYGVSIFIDGYEIGSANINLK